MQVRRIETIELSDEEVNRIFRQELSSLREGYWLRDGKLWTEHCGSHCSDFEVPRGVNSELAPEAWDIVKAAIELDNALGPRKR